MAKNKQTEGKVAFRGKLLGLKKAKDNIKDNERQRQINFIVKTDKDNAHYLTVNQWKGGMKKAYLFKNTDDGNEQKVVSWAERYDYVDDGFNPIGVKTKKKGSDKTVNLYEYDFIDFLFENYEDGDSVYIRGKMTFSQGKDKVYKNIDVTHLFPTTEEINFKNPDFEETADFELSFVFKGSNVIDDKVITEGIVFDYKENPLRQNFVVYNDAPDLQKFLVKEAGYGDMFKVEGMLHNRVTYKDKEKGKVDGSGMGKKRGSFENSYTEREIESERKELEIVYSEMPTTRVYTKKEIENMKNSSSNSSSKKSNNKDIKPEKTGTMPWE